MLTICITSTWLPVEERRLWITTRLLHRVRQNKRGVSNVIIVVLSLVILVIITSNVILWSYQMNQLDWEKMQEDIAITDMTSVNSSGWFTAQNEYSVPMGMRASGSCEYTRAIDTFYESFREADQVTILPEAAGQYAEWDSTYPSGTLHWECCDDDPADDDDSYVRTANNSWQREAYNLGDPVDQGNIAWVRVYIRARIDTAGPSPYIRTLIRTYGVDYSSPDKALTSSYQDFYTQYDINPFTGLSWTWDSVKSLQAGAIGRSFGGGCTSLTAVWVVVNYDGHRARVRGNFAIDVSICPLESLKGLELQLRFRASDSGERWFLKAFNWTSGVYSDQGFNSTVGYLPTTAWGCFTVNLTDQWRSYTREDGSMIIELVEAGVDANQTTIDVDFLAIRAFVEGAQFSFHNKGPSTCHIVSIWVVASDSHDRCELNVFLNSGERLNYTRTDVVLPASPYFVKVITERGNVAVYSAN